MSNNTVTKQCPNPDCDNVELIDVETDGDKVYCKECGTELEVFSYADVDEFEENEEEMDDEEPDFTENDFIDYDVD
jgi:hypothetical protein